ncbi:EamA family transporter [Elizabethkingia argentiflava]|uniref:EamA family transporter n=2 Tax=Elizabethkingia argenteiflava TaxID=2681556 RepID=A0A845PTB6_9FLAO|nr:EamA family transporter [Elizabethkingia argenteiflava]
MGYGIFSVLIKKFDLKGRLYLTRLLLFLGSMFLSIPYFTNIHPIEFSYNKTIRLLSLSFSAYNCGLLLHTKSLTYLSLSKVQVTELSETVFSAILAWLFLKETPSS